MNPEKPLQIILPSEFGQQHYDALIAYLVDSRKLTTAVLPHFAIQHQTFEKQTNTKA